MSMTFTTRVSYPVGALKELAIVIGVAIWKRPVPTPSFSTNKPLLPKRNTELNENFPEIWERPLSQNLFIYYYVIIVVVIIIVIFKCSKLGPKTKWNKQKGLFSSPLEEITMTELSISLNYGPPRVLKAKVFFITLLSLWT